MGDIPYAVKEERINKSQKARFTQNEDPLWSTEQLEHFLENIKEITMCRKSNVFLFGSDRQVVSHLPLKWDKVFGAEWRVYFLLVIKDM